MDIAKENSINKIKKEVDAKADKTAVATKADLASESGKSALIMSIIMS